jgi:hypothetical protein
MKIRPVEAELFHADGQTDMTKLTVAFRNFANAPKNVHARNFKPVSSRLFVNILRDMADKIFLAGKIVFLLQYVESITVSLSLGISLISEATLVG